MWVTRGQTVTEDNVGDDGTNCDIEENVGDEGTKCDIKENVGE